MVPVSEKENLKREIGVRALALAIINIVAGSGIFVIPAIIAVELGAAAIIPYLICGALIFLIGLCFAELGSKTTISGGFYVYIEKAFGPYSGFLASNLYWIGGAVLADAAIANALADTLKYFFPLLNDATYRVVFLFFSFSIIALLNIRSLKNGVRFIEFASSGKLIALIILIVASTGHISTENLRWVSTPSLGSIGSASLLLFFAFLGMEAPLSNGGEMKNPKRTVPLGIFFGITTILILYISIQIVTQGVLGTTVAEHKDAPLVAVASIVFGKTGAIVIVAATALSMFGVLCGDILSVPRIIYASARDGLMPKPLAKVHPRFFTPHIAILFYASLGFLLSLSSSFKQLATMASAFVLVVYLGTVLAAMRLRYKESGNPEKTFRIPGGIIVPVLAASCIIWILSNLSRQEFKVVSILILVLSIIYLVSSLLKKKKSRI